MTEHEPEPGTPEYELAQVEADGHFDGIFLTQEERELLLRLFRGEITREQYDEESDRMIFGDGRGNQETRPAGVPEPRYVQARPEGPGPPGRETTMSEPEPGTPEYELAQVEANSAFEGIFMPPEERELLLRYIRGEITREQYNELADKLVFGDPPEDDQSNGA